MDVEKPEINVKPQALPIKKRVAHEVKHTEVHASFTWLIFSLHIHIQGKALNRKR